MDWLICNGITYTRIVIINQLLKWCDNKDNKIRDVRGAKKIAPHRTATFTPLHRTAPHRNYSKISHTAPHRTAALQKFRTPHRTAPQKFLKIAHCTAPHRTAPHRTTPHRTAPQCTALYSTKMLLRTRLHKV